MNQKKWGEGVQTEWELSKVPDPRGDEREAASRRLRREQPSPDRGLSLGSRTVVGPGRGGRRPALQGMGRWQGGQGDSSEEGPSLPEHGRVREECAGKEGGEGAGVRLRVVEHL